MLSVFGLGNPLMDIILDSGPELLASLQAVAGSMNLVEFETQKQVIRQSSNPRFSAGGSCANTIRGLAWLAAGDATIGPAAYTGAIGTDEYGDRFERALTERGVVSRLVRKPVPTGTSAVVVTPDFERTMFTHLGACREFTPDDLDLGLLSDACIFHTTGYMWDTPNQERAARSAIEFARTKNIVVSFDIADPFVARRYRDSLLAWLPGRVDILFANIEELRAMTDCPDDSPGSVLRKAERFAPTVVLKVGPDGCMVQSNDGIVRVPGERVRARDTTGAGDAFAAGYLYAYLRTASPYECGTLANRIASRIVTVAGCDYESLDRALVSDIAST